MFRVVEKFVSINGEGCCAGKLACFIRFAGCNLNCSYCDTGWANAQDVDYETMSAEQIKTYIEKKKVDCVTITGGEPMLQPDIRTLLYKLSENPMLRVEVETNGSIGIDEYENRPDNLCFTLDYKLPGSGMEENMRTDNYAFLKKQDAVKFVVCHRQDLERAKEIIRTYRLTKQCQVFLSSAFEEITPAEIVEYMIQENLKDLRIQLQMHKYIWDPNKKGV